MSRGAAGCLGLTSVACDRSWPVHAPASHGRFDLRLFGHSGLLVDTLQHARPRGIQKESQVVGIKSQFEGIKSQEEGMKSQVVGIKTQVVDIKTQVVGITHRL